MYFVGASLENFSVTTSRIPQISDTGKHYKPTEALPVHERLHKHAVQKQAEAHNQLVDYMQSKLNISLKPWEVARTNGTPMHGSTTSAQANQDLQSQDNSQIYNPAHAYIKVRHLSLVSIGCHGAL